MQESFNRAQAYPQPAEGEVISDQSNFAESKTGVIDSHVCRFDEIDSKHKDDSERLRPPGGFGNAKFLPQVLRSKPLLSTQAPDNNAVDPITGSSGRVNHPNHPQDFHSQVLGAQQEQHQLEGRLPRGVHKRDPRYIQAPQFNHTHFGAEASHFADTGTFRSTPHQGHEKMSNPKISVLDQSTRQARPESEASNGNGQELDAETGWSIVQDMVAKLQSDQLRVQQSVSLSYVES